MISIPFNFDPTANATVKTTSTTVGAGKYALVFGIHPDLQLDSAFVNIVYNGSLVSGTSTGVDVDIPVATRGDYVIVTTVAEGAADVRTLSDSVVGLASSTTAFTVSGGADAQTLMSFVRGDLFKYTLTQSSANWSYVFQVLRPYNGWIFAKAGQVITGSRYMYIEYTSLT